MVYLLQLRCCLDHFRIRSQIRSQHRFQLQLHFLLYLFLCLFLLLDFRCCLLGGELLVVAALVVPGVVAILPEVQLLSAPPVVDPPLPRDL